MGLLKTLKEIILEDPEGASSGVSIDDEESDKRENSEFFRRIRRLAEEERKSK